MSGSPSVPCLRRAFHRSMRWFLDAACRISVVAQGRPRLRRVAGRLAVHVGMLAWLECCMSASHVSCRATRGFDVLLPHGRRRPGCSCVTGASESSFCRWALLHKREHGLARSRRVWRSCNQIQDMFGLMPSNMLFGLAAAAFYKVRGWWCTSPPPL